MLIARVRGEPYRSPVDAKEDSAMAVIRVLLLEVRAGGWMLGGAGGWLRGPPEA
jgi:hypothetical protein